MGNIFLNFGVVGDCDHWNLLKTVSKILSTFVAAYFGYSSSRKYTLPLQKISPIK